MRLKFKNFDFLRNCQVWTLQFFNLQIVIHYYPDHLSANIQNKHSRPTPYFRPENTLMKHLDNLDMRWTMKEWIFPI